MMARLEMGEVLLATRIGDVLRQVRVGIVTGNAALPQQLAEHHSIHLREFGRLTERERSLSIERDGELGPEPRTDLGIRNTEPLDHRVRDMQGHDHKIPLFGPGRPAPRCFTRPIRRSRA